MADKNQSRLLDKFLYKFYPKLLYKKTTYSQTGEDLLIKNCLAFLKITAPGYIDIGAHHPYYLNNTALLYEDGCKGINIEPNPVLFNYFSKFRTRDINLNIGAGVQKGEETFYMISTSTLSTFSKSEAEEYAKMGYKITGTPTLKIDTIPNIIRERTNGKFPEILSIDVEGLDHVILESLDLSANYPKIICAETTRFEPEFDMKNKDHELIELLTAKGYAVFADTFINTIFYKK